MKKESITIRIILIVGVILLLFIPLMMIQSLIEERQTYRDEAETEINQSWGSRQTLGGPLLTFEKKVKKVNQSGIEFTETSYKHFLPDTLFFECALEPEIRYRGIYEFVLYKGKIKIYGSFSNSGISDMSKDTEATVDKYLSFNVSDLRGIRENIFINWDGMKYETSPGLKLKNIFQNGFYVNIKHMESKDKYDFEIELSLRGSEIINFLPLGRLTNVHVSSEWENPSFIGSYLPVFREVNDDGFRSTWQVNHFNRDYPQVWDNNNYEIFNSAFGVKLLMQVDEYQKTMRTSKYGMMIILLTFVSFFMIEVFSKKVIHPVQYLLVGLSLIIFYSLLLAISEYIVFQHAYLITSFLVISLNGIYVKNIYSSVRFGFIISVIMIIFYGFMFIILQLQDYSLLLGNFALFLVLSIIMYLTRKVNWYEVFNVKKEV